MVTKAHKDYMLKRFGHACTWRPEVDTQGLLQSLSTLFCETEVCLQKFRGSLGYIIRPSKKQEKKKKAKKMLKLKCRVKGSEIIPRAVLQRTVISLLYSFWLHRNILKHQETGGKRSTASVQRSQS